MPDAVGWSTMMSLSPVLFFLASVPVGFVAGSGIAVAVWFLAIPFQVVAQRHRPPAADQFGLT